MNKIKGNDLDNGNDLRKLFLDNKCNKKRINYNNLNFYVFV